LVSRRNAIYDTICNGWAAIGWKLQTARSPENVRNALAPLGGGQRFATDPSIDRFLVPDQVDSEPNRATLRVLKLEYKQVITRLRDRETERQEEEEWLRKMAEAANAEKRQRRLQKEYIAQRRRTQKLVRACKQVREHEMKLRSEIRAVEARLALVQILRFIQQRRYSFNPSNLANAMAGLPEIGWRRSNARCMTIKGLMAEHFSYRLFMTMRSLLNKCDESRFKLTTCIQRNILRTRMDDYVRSHLCENWLFLKRTLEKINIRSTHPGELPFVVCDMFQRKTNAPRSNVDEILRDREKIVLKGR
jgi:chemotaxis protein histidine kinase CheA